MTKIILQMAHIFDSVYTFRSLIKAWAAKITDKTQKCLFLRTEGYNELDEGEYENLNYEMKIIQSKL